MAVHLQSTVVAELHQLRAFLAVARRGSFSGAADDLRLSQQAVSRAVATLEQELGTDLLERHARGARKTAAGDTLQRDAERLLADLDIALDRARQAGGGATGVLRIAATPAIPDTELAELTARLRARAPEAEISLTTVSPRDTEGLLTRGDADIVLARTQPVSPEIAVHDLAPTVALLAMPVTHRLAPRSKVSVTDLDGEKLLVFSERSPFTDHLLSIVATVTVTPVTAKVVGRGAIAQLVDGDAVAIMPSGTAAWPGVTFAEFDPPVHLPLSAATRRWGLRPLAQRFLDATADSNRTGR